MGSPTPGTTRHIHSQARALRDLGGTQLLWTLTRPRLYPQTHLASNLTWAHQPCDRGKFFSSVSLGTQFRKRRQSPILQGWGAIRSCCHPTVKIRHCSCQVAGLGAGEVLLLTPGHISKGICPGGGSSDSASPWHREQLHQFS